MKPWKAGAVAEKKSKKTHAEFEEQQALRTPAEHIKEVRYWEAESRYIRRRLGLPPRPRRPPTR